MSQESGKGLVLRNARLVLPDEVVEGRSLVIDGGRIVTISGVEKISSPGEEDLDLQDLTVLPGFIDVHIHGAVGVDTMEASPGDLKRVSQFLATRGVTGWVPTLVPAPDVDYARAIDAIGQALKSKLGARILGVHYEGPFVNSAQCGALRAAFFRTFSSAIDLDDLPVLDQNGARHMMTLAPEIDGGVELVHELSKRGWVVSLGHTRADVGVLERAYEAGARHMTHFMNAMGPLHHRAPGPVAWGLSRDEVTCDVIADGIHLDPFILRLLLKTKGADRLALISDAIAAAGKGDGEYQVWSEKISVKSGRTSNSRGNIAGSVITMLDAVKMMLSLDANHVDVARMAASNPARLLRVDGDCGSIEEGKRADLVALDEAGNVHLTMVGGQVVFQVSAA